MRHSLSTSRHKRAASDDVTSRRSRAAPESGCGVTGSGRGVGAATARAVADGGFTVAVLARSTKEVNEVALDIEKDGGSAFGSRAASGMGCA